MTASFKEMIEGLHIFTYDMDIYMDQKEARRKRFEDEEVQEIKRSTATPTDVLKSLHNH